MQRWLVNLIGVLLTWAAWVWAYVTPLSGPALTALAVAGTLAGIPVVLVGRWLLDREPTLEKAREVTTWIHYLLAIFFGSGIMAATRFAVLNPVWTVNLPMGLGLALMFASSLLFLLVVLNLALKGLGGPFAAALTRSVATEWFYAWTRNPMILAGLTLLVGVGLYLQSGLYLLWLLVIVGPAMLIFIKVYEERELEIRFGRSYLDYKARTPGFFPRRPL